MQLARAEEDYRSLFENAVDGIFQTRPDGSYLRANPALATLYGYASPAELMAELRATNLYVEPGRRAEFARRMREHDAVSEFESAVRRKDGTMIWISENSRAIRDEQGEIVRYEGMVVDVTERRRAQEALRESEARFQSIVANMPGMVYRFVLRPDGTDGLPLRQRRLPGSVRPGPRRGPAGRRPGPRHRPAGGSGRVRAVHRRVRSHPPAVALAARRRAP